MVSLVVGLLLVGKGRMHKLSQGTRSHVFFSAHVLPIYVYDPLLKDVKEKNDPFLLAVGAMLLVLGWCIYAVQVDGYVTTGAAVGAFALLVGHTSLRRITKVGTATFAKLAASVSQDLVLEAYRDSSETQVQPPLNYFHPLPLLSSLRCYRSFVCRSTLQLNQSLGPLDGKVAKAILQVCEIAAFSFFPVLFECFVPAC